MTVLSPKCPFFKAKFVFGQEIQDAAAVRFKFCWQTPVCSPGLLVTEGKGFARLIYLHLILHDIIASG